MKTVIRTGVFETNSSSLHTLMIMSQDELSADRKSEKPKTRKFETITTKKDKLYLACGCCHEIFTREEYYLNYCSDDEARAEYFALKNHEVDPEEAYFSKYDFSYEVAIDHIVRVYCRLTGEDYDAVMQEVDSINKSGRACHMKFFDEGSLYDPDYDYMIITDLFYGSVDGIDRHIEAYFDDDKVVCYREFWNGIGFSDDDDD